MVIVCNLLLKDLLIGHYLPHQSVDHGVAGALQVRGFRVLLRLGHLVRHGELGHGDVVLSEEVVGRRGHLTRHRVPPLVAPPEHGLLQLSIYKPPVARFRHGHKLQIIIRHI